MSVENTAVEVRRPPEWELIYLLAQYACFVPYSCGVCRECLSCRARDLKAQREGQ